MFFFGIHFFLEEEQVNEADSHYWPIPGTTFKGFFASFSASVFFLHNVQAVDIIMLYCDSTSMYNALIIHLHENTQYVQRNEDYWNGIETFL